MFELIFRADLSNITSDNSIIENLWSEIKLNYSKPDRFYHTLLHLDNLTTELLAVKEKISDWQTLIFSIAYHDIIYIPLKQDNEEKSAALAFNRLTLLNLPNARKHKCKQQIIATKRHNISADNDTNYFTDADLAILGSEPDVYNNYSNAIRKEYKQYPNAVYKQGRKKFLSHFLQMPEIYKTTYFECKYELRARQNLIKELGELS